MSAAPSFEAAGRDWLNSLPTKVRRNGRPLSANTQRIYERNFARIISQLRKERLPVTNRTLQEYVAWMRAKEYKPGKKYSASQIVGDVAVIKLICESIRDDNLECVFPLRIAHEEVQTPIVDPEQQTTPEATREEIERALSMSGVVSGVIAVAAGAGLRISEILAVKYGDEHRNEDAWDPNTATITIRKTLKTPNAARTVYINAELNSFLLSWVNSSGTRVALGESLFDIPRSSVYALLKKAKLPPPHSYRRFYATHRDEMGMNDQVLKQLMGHSKGRSQDTTRRYKFTAKNIGFVIAEVERCGLGFDLPVIAANQPKLAST